MGSLTTATQWGPINAAFSRLLYGILGSWLIIGVPLFLHIVVVSPSEGAMIPVAVMLLGAYLLAAVLWIPKGLRVIELSFWNGFLIFSIGLVVSALQGVFFVLSGIHIPYSFILYLTVAFLGFWWLENRKIVRDKVVDLMEALESETKPEKS